MLRLPWAVREELRLREEVEREVFDFLEMEHLRRRTVGSLSYGLQKRVDLARALAMRPRVLLLDEPVAGMNEEETEDMARFILDVQEERGITVVLIEHDMGVVMDLCDRVVALSFGETIGEGTPAEIQRDPEVVRAYLGEAA
jgi:branched-chain amino acid transport system ATP-binding protein